MRIFYGYLILIVVLALQESPLRANQFFIAPDGSNSNAGSIDSPWGTFDYAINQLDSGDTLWVRDGTFDIGSTVEIDHGGSSGSPIHMRAYEDEVPILDFSGQADDGANRGIEISGSGDWWHIQGLTIQNAGDNGLYTEGDNGIFEQLVLRHNRDSGFQLHGTASNNLILNSDSYGNYDPPKRGEDADGFAVKHEDIGPGNIFRGNRAWANSDDGWDTYRAAAHGVLILESWSFDNGLDPASDPDTFNGDGTGYKLGKPGGDHVITNVLAVDNASNGVDVNENGTGVQVYNSTSFSNHRNWQFDDDTATHILKNNLSYAGNSSDNFSSSDSQSETNSWDPGFFVSASDFVSTDRFVGMTDLLKRPRQVDGSLPDLGGFLKLADTSDLIDTGTPISFLFNGITYNLPFNGSAPDLGAFETGSAAFADADFDQDEDVDGADFLIWQRGFGLDGQTDNRQGDANGDTYVDGDDLALWESRFGPSALSTVAIGVPEPATLLLLGMVAGIRTLKRWRRQATVHRSE